MNHTDKFLLEQISSWDWDFQDEKTDGLTHGMHPYPAKFIPQIPNQLIQALSEPGDTIADIFCGSGTTLVEATVMGRNAIGIDANPLACLISKAKTTRLVSGDSEQLNALVSKAITLAENLSIAETPLFKSNSFVSKASRPEDDAITFWFEPFVVEELAEIKDWFNNLSTPSSKLIASTAFSSIVVSVSKQDSDTRYVRRDKNLRPGDVFKRFSNALGRSVVAAEKYTEHATGTSKIIHADLLTKPNVGSFDLMICSPPYPNAYSYHLYHMTRMIWLGMDYREFKRLEIGSHRKFSKKNASIELFREEMATIFDWLSEQLIAGRQAVFVIGDSIISGQLIDNAELLSNIAGEHGFREDARIVRHLQTTKRAFNPKIGRIKSEKILILTRK